jgi:hypothetical protein
VEETEARIKRKYRNSLVLLRWRTIVGSKTLKPTMPGHALFFRQDCRVFAFQVTDFKPDCVKMRILASAP